MKSRITINTRRTEWRQKFYSRSYSLSPQRICRTNIFSFFALALCFAFSAGAVDITPPTNAPAIAHKILNAPSISVQPIIIQGHGQMVGWQDDSNGVPQLWVVNNPPAPHYGLIFNKLNDPHLKPWDSEITGVNQQPNYTQIILQRNEPAGFTPTTNYWRHFVCLRSTNGTDVEVIGCADTSSPEIIFTDHNPPKMQAWYWATNCPYLPTNVAAELWPTWPPPNN